MSDLIKRKDGSYSRRGLWDNIRANKGSGKKPTKEMLAQERKIKNMQDGGKLSYEEWKKKYNLKETDDYKLKRAWELGYVPDAKGHLPTIDNQTLDFLKSGSHPTIKKELEWYNSPEGAEFKKKYQIDSTKQFWKYRPIVNNMESGGSIPERYRNMGFSRVGQKKESTNEGKKWMVLAKKGDQYKVVHGGYKGMQDFKQHGSEQRKKNFWNRMGGRDSSKANDPFSPLYWHKRLGTWEKGGKLSNDKQMVDGIADILQRVKDRNNRKAIADKMISDFKKEKVNYNRKDFLAKSNLPQYQLGGWLKDFVEKVNPFNWFSEDEKEPSKPVVKEKSVDSNKVPSRILEAQGYKESTYNPNAFNKGSKAAGWAQIKDIARRDYNQRYGTNYTQKDLFNPEIAIKMQTNIMNSLYNRPWVNVPGQPEDVRVAKALIGYNQGATATLRKLNDLKEKGIDIYKNTDWVKYFKTEPRQYVEKILLRKDPKFNREYDSASQVNPYVKYYRKEEGGVITDPRGQWAYPGEITRIPGNSITMEGVEGPILGVADTGEQKLMLPGKNYKFEENVKYVTEYPIEYKNGGIMNKLGDVSENRRNLLKQGIDATLYPFPFAKGGKMYKQGGIFIKPENRGKFTAWAKSKGMGVQEAASKVMANKEDYSPTIVKRANFAKNAAGWSKGMGGTFANRLMGDMTDASGPKSFAAGGGIDNPGFKALPDFVQAKIKANMELGGSMKPRFKTKFY